ncbi:site-specific integrase [Rhizobium leguminosarum bv. viciae 248]|uniref:tyrosine-type recombinase/integrase n=1 Tax=Rhizobium leguminosarum TaxID=384 RepID=UPI00037F96FC|nr:site-specific integrase [Rhizobium leguminosarum]QHW24733.1 site-specific integrase [Rhizobium leguminosarum bv. viciae 248]
MASITKRAGKWTVTARVPENFRGPCKARSISNTFKSKRAAQTWIDATESAMRLGTWSDPRLEKVAGEPKPPVTNAYLDQPFKKALGEYRDKVTPEKKGEPQEIAMLNMLARQPFAIKTLRELSVDDFVSYRDARRKKGRAASTIRNNLNTVAAVFEWLIHEKSVPVSNPIASLRKRRRGIPQPGAGRERRLRAGEEDRIWASLHGDTWQSREWQALFPVLLDTGMRAGEVRSIRASWVRREHGFIVIPEENVKGKEHRYVALSDRAYGLLLKQAEGKRDSAPIFTMTKNSAEHEWQKVRVAAECPDLRIHDLRHEALSRMAANGADLRTLMRQSGHKTVAVLMRYLNPTKEEQRARLFGASRAEAIAA